MILSEELGQEGVAFSGKFYHIGKNYESVINFGIMVFLHVDYKIPEKEENVMYIVLLQIM